MIELLIFFVLPVIALTLYIKTYKHNTQKKYKSSLVLTKDIAKQFLDRSYTDFNHHSILYAAHIAVFITLFTIMINIYSYDFDFDFDFDVIQYNVSKQNNDLYDTIPFDNKTMNYQVNNDEIKQANIFTYKLIIICIFMIASTLLYLSMVQEFVILANIKELIKLLEYKLDTPYTHIIEKGYYVLTWKYIGVYDGMNRIILIFISCILLFFLLSLYDSIVATIIIVFGVLRLFSVLINIINRKNK